MAELLIRGLLALAIMVAGALLYWSFGRWALRRARGNTADLAGLQPGIPAVLYFTTPQCAPCRTVQRPALVQLQEWLADSIQVIEVDAARRPALADSWGVLTVPTTFLIDSRGRTRRVNQGVVRAENLLAQLEAIEGPLPVRGYAGSAPGNSGQDILAAPAERRSSR